jgi:hypothetical protein
MRRAVCLQSKINWCRDQQRAALDHMRPDHSCSHPQCAPENNRLWLMDALAEEIELAYFSGPREGEAECVKLN